jgi:DNA polymerase-3 subunit gamma/tau
MIALARRYRPKRFADLLVQDHVTGVLRAAVASNRVGHGYLLTGPRGVGKTTAARILAMALNCPNRESSGEPCGECDECLRVWNGSANLDGSRSTPPAIAAWTTPGICARRSPRRVPGGRYKARDEAHMLTRGRGTLLKILRSRRHRSCSSSPRPD